MGSVGQKHGFPLWQGYQGADAEWGPSKRGHALNFVENIGTKYFLQ